MVVVASVYPFVSILVRDLTAFVLFLRRSMRMSVSITIRLVSIVSKPL